MTIHGLLHGTGLGLVAMVLAPTAFAQTAVQTTPPTPSATDTSASAPQATAPASAPVPGDASSAPATDAEQPGPLPSAAQDGSSSAPTPQQDIVVTGTLLRGVAPVGTNVIGLNRDQIASTGAVSTQQLLATVPQLSSLFNSVPTVGSGGSGLTVVRPNIRNLAANGGNTTLVLFDGHNAVGAGVLQTTPDIGVIPPGAIERVDVVPDGGSSLYGSDAVGGIVNLITRKKFDGVEILGHIGAAQPYKAGDVNVTAGHGWSTGSALLSYSFRSNSDLVGFNRSYFRTNLTPFGGSDNRVTTCTPGNVTVGGVNYALPNRVANTTNRCDLDLNRDLFPAERQHSVFGSLTQNLGEQLTFSLTGLFTDRKTTSTADYGGTSGVGVTSSNPYFRTITGETSQSVAYSYANVTGFGLARSTTGIQLFQVTPQLEYKFGGGWKVTALGNFGRSVTTARTSELNSAAEATALAGTTLATALNPYDPAASNRNVLAGILNFEQYARSRQTLAEGRVVVDGTLLTLPGGNVRLAVGGQYQYTQAKLIQTDAAIGDLSTAARASADRDVAAVFGELLVPIFGSGNSLPGLRSLVLDGSVRYDHYSDFGGTTNPKIGVTWKPIDSLTIRGNYGTSFNAPSLADSAGAIDTRAQVLPVSPFQPAFNFGNFLRPTILLAGGNPNLRPQTADTYSVGADFHPAFFQPLTLSLTYWNVKLSDVILVTPFFNSSIFTNPGLAGYYTLNPTLAQAQALTSGLRVQGPSIASLYANGNAPYAIFNAMRNNLGKLNVDGLDFNAVLNGKTRFGAVSASFGGSLTLDRTSSTAGSATFDELYHSGVSPLQFVSSIGDRIGNLTTRATVNYSEGYRVENVVNQARVSSFTTTNLFVGYDFPENGSLRGAGLTLNIDNVFDARPPFYNITGNTNTIDGTANGSTLGRLINVGLRLKF